MIALAGLVWARPRIGPRIALAAASATLIFVAVSIATGTLFAPAAEDEHVEGECGYARAC